MGFIEDGVYLYQGLPDDLDKLKSYKAIANIINPPLYDFQCVDLLRALFVRRFIANYETGIGKTYLASAFMKAIKNTNPKAKFLFFIKNSQIKETPRKVYNACGLKCTVVTAESSNKLTQFKVDAFDVIMMTHETLSSPDHMLSLMKFMDKFTGIVADEAHLLSNLEEASSAYTLYCLSHRVQYFLSLTATPITTDVEQFARLLKVTDPFDVDNFKKIGYDMKKFGLAGIPSKLRDLFVVRQREFNNHRSLIEMISPMPYQIGARGKNLFLKTKGEGATKQMHRLVCDIRERQPKKGIVYVNRKYVYKALVPYLEKSGIRFNYINGWHNNKPEDRDRISKEFREGKYDVLLLNTKEAIDLDCDYVYFYEFTVHVKQFIGRGERGINPKALEVIFLFTDKTDEYDYFLRNIYNISQEVQEILGMNYSDITDITNFKKVE